jgi:hypothetical protein
MCPSSELLDMSESSDGSKLRHFAHRDLIIGAHMAYCEMVGFLPIDP